MTQMTARPCGRCGWALDPFALVCGRCRALAYQGELERLAAEAFPLEWTDPAAAAVLWRRCLDLLPRDAAQYAAVYQRYESLVARGKPAWPVRPFGAPPAPPPPPGYDDPYAATGGELRAGAAAAAPAEDAPAVAVLKTAGSMAVSILAYALFVPGDLAGRLLFATGFVVLILVHELGHVAAMRYYGLSASPPVFIPFLGAMIRLRGAPADARVEAVVGLGGPVLGTVGALACYGLYFAVPPADEDGRALVLLLAHFGFMLNLFNMLPLPPLDGGRITAAVSPKLWVLGLAGLVALLVREVLAGHALAVLVLGLVLMFALPRVRGTLARRGPRPATADPYYAISPASRRTIAAVYVGLGVTLLVFRFLTRHAVDGFIAVTATT